MGVAGFRNGPLPATLTRRIFRGDQPQVLHELSRVLEACQVAQFRDHGDGHGKLHPAQGLKRLDHRVQAPRFDLLLDLLFQTLQAFRVFGDRRTYSWKTICCAGVGQTTSLSHRRWAGPQVAWPV